jgi:hypothetical protein
VAPGSAPSGRSLLQSVAVPTAVSPNTRNWLVAVARNATTKLLDESAAKKGAPINGSSTGFYVGAAKFLGKDAIDHRFQVRVAPLDTVAAHRCTGRCCTYTGMHTQFVCTWCSLHFIWRLHGCAVIQSRLC